MEWVSQSSSRPYTSSLSRPRARSPGPAPISSSAPTPETLGGTRRSSWVSAPEKEHTLGFISHELRGIHAGDGLEVRHDVLVVTPGRHGSDRLSPHFLIGVVAGTLPRRFERASRVLPVLPVRRSKDDSNLLKRFLTQPGRLIRDEMDERRKVGH